jgi:hypothetical protein
MMAKDRRQRPDSMWEFLKEFRGMKLFKPKIGQKAVDPNQASDF